LHAAGDGEDFVGTDLRVERGAFEEINGGTALRRRAADRADGRAGIVRVLGAIEFAVGFFLGGHFAVGHPRAAGVVTIALRVVEADAGRRGGAESLRHLASDADADGRVGAAAGVVEITANPAVVFKFFGVGSGLPDFGGTEMGTIGIGIADALHDAQIPGVVQILEAGQTWMQADVIVDLENGFWSTPMRGALCDSNRWSKARRCSNRHCRRPVGG
jgi:hypothetical protein